MIRIGMVDQYLNNWHTDHYPVYMKVAAETFGHDIAVTAAWAEQGRPDGLIGSEEWCRSRQITLMPTYEQLIDSVDGIMVMCADNCLLHEELVRKALESGKPVYCDKTFAPDVEAAARMFDRAQRYSTPLFSCSAQRFCMELLGYRMLQKGPTMFCGTTGPGDLINYSVHQFEMIEAVMGTGAARCMGHAAGGTAHVVYEYRDGRIATFTLSPKAPFTLIVSDAEQKGENITVSDYYMNFMQVLCTFFENSQPPVARKDTMEIMAMQQAARRALANAGQWMRLSAIR